MALPLDTRLDLSEVDIPVSPAQTRNQYLKDALSRNPELQAAKETVVKTHQAVTAARDEYIPDITLFARHTYQDGVPFITHNIGTYGVQLTWNVFD